MVRIAPAPWSPAFRDRDRVLARAAIRRGAAQKIRELTPLIQELRSHELGSVVEIGTDLGGSLYLWCRLAAADATIVSIDLPGGAFGRSEAAVAARTLGDYARDEQHLHLLQLDSHRKSTLARLAEILRSRPVDLLMIDGDHSYEGVKTDFELYSPLVADGGLVVLHDILPNEVSPDCHVDRLWRELRARYEVTEFVDAWDDRGLGSWGGIGVIHWRRDRAEATA
jgi:predicted O-methyltransferase YrrM